MAKRRAAWWWIDRWRKSTAYTDMTLAEQGAYRNLLDELWLRGGCLPDDDRILAKVSGAAIEWPSVRLSVMKRFYRTDAGWRHETHDEIAGGSKFHKSQSDKGKKGAEARWGRNREDSRAIAGVPENDGPANGPANARMMAFRTPYSVSEDNGSPPIPPADAGGDFELAPGLQEPGHGNGADPLSPEGRAAVVEAAKRYAIETHGYRLDRNDVRRLREAVNGGHTLDELKASIDAAKARGQPTLSPRRL